MNKNIIIAAVVILALAAGAFVVFKRTQPINPETTQIPLSSQTANPESLTQKTSIKTLLGTGGSQTCTYKDQQSGSGGTVYIQDGKMRGDFSTQVQTQVTTSHMIMDKEYSYMWMNDDPTGFKVSVVAMDELKNKMAPKGAQAVDINQELDYDCSTGSIDSSVFAVPTDKTFTDYSAMMKDATNMMKQPEVGGSAMPNKEEACAACAGLPADAQAQCKAALSCN